MQQQHPDQDRSATIIRSQLQQHPDPGMFFSTSMQQHPDPGMLFTTSMQQQHPDPGMAFTTTRMQQQKKGKQYKKTKDDLNSSPLTSQCVCNVRQFLRVLPLPSENWSSLVEEWCCHPDPFVNRSCLPKVNDCFLGDTFLLVNKANISDPPRETNEMSSVPHPVVENVSKSKENTKVVCKRCKAILGETVSSEAIKYHITEVMILPSSEAYCMIARKQFVESVIVQLMMELSTSRSTFRFCVQGQDGKFYLLVR
ncbi:unnamed protein product, partial [Ranitomeya imitator]